MPSKEKTLPEVAVDEATQVPPKEDTIAKSEYDRVVTEYNKLASAFSKLLREYNDLHVKNLFEEK